jgi:aldose 1-epimerase
MNPGRDAATPDGPALPPGAGAVTLTAPGGRLSATFLTGLGMVGSSLRHDGEELLAQRGGPEAYAQRGSTFGIPLLHPWANRLGAWSYEAAGRHVDLDRGSSVTRADKATGLPIHGLLAASRLWQVADQGSDHLTAELDFGARPELLAAFPFPHRLQMRMRTTADALRVELEVTPTADLPVPLSFGFHPYLSLPGSPRQSWRIEVPVARRALLDENGIPTGEDRPIRPGALDGPLADRTFDDSFDKLAQPPVFSLSDERRRIRLSFEAGYTNTQLYAPEGSEFICCEPMTAPVDALRSGRGLRFAQPGASFTAAFVLTVTNPAPEGRVEG